MLIFKVVKIIHMDMHPTECEPEYFTSPETAKQCAEAWDDREWGQIARIETIEVNTSNPK